MNSPRRHSPAPLKFPAMKVYNTLTGKEEEFKTVDPHIVRMYVCGMTVQDSPHAGHMRTFTSFDVIRRYLEYKGFEVRHIQNFTDIDDKIIIKSKEQGLDWRVLAYRYMEEYKKVADMMNFRPPIFYPQATIHIQEIIEITAALVNKGIAYVVDGNVWYDVSKFPEYGKLSKKSIEELKEGARIEPDPTKRNAPDFALWKKRKPGEPYWYSPWGEGRPGWHIECSAMSITHLGETLDIHGGAEDLIFPHHENEIAQSEAYTGKPFANYWLHAGFLTLKGEKMSKSIGNIFRATDLLERFDANTVRLFYLKAHYRSRLDFSEELLEDARRGWQRIKNFLQDARGLEGNILPEYMKQFEEAMDDDFNTPKAIALLFNMINEGYRNKDRMPHIAQTLRLILATLGFRLDEEEAGDRLQDVMDILIGIRNELRKRKEFDLSDRIRDELKKVGILLEDSKEGTRWKIV